jgi:hypothetical protein
LSGAAFFVPVRFFFALGERTRMHRHTITHHKQLTATARAHHDRRLFVFETKHAFTQQQQQRDVVNVSLSSSRRRPVVALARLSPRLFFCGRRFLLQRFCGFKFGF